MRSWLPLKRGGKVVICTPGRTINRIRSPRLATELAESTLPSGSAPLLLLLKPVSSIWASHISELILGHAESSTTQCCPSNMVVTRLGLVVVPHNGE